MNNVFLLYSYWIKLLVIIIRWSNLSCSRIFWKLYWNVDIDCVFGTLKSIPWPQPCVGLHSINILYPQSTDPMNNLNSLRRTVHSSTSPYLSWLFARLFLRKPAFSLMIVCVGFVVDKGVLVQYFLQVFWFSPASYQPTKGTQLSVIRGWHRTHFS
jgi:hypothetical protein